MIQYWSSSRKTEKPCNVMTMADASLTSSDLSLTSRGAEYISTTVIDLWAKRICLAEMATRLDHKDYGDTIVQQNRLIWWEEYNVIFIIIIIIIRGFPYHAVNKLLSLR